MPWGDNTKGTGPWGPQKGSGGGHNQGTPPPDFDAFLKKAKDEFGAMFGGGGKKKGSSNLPFILIGLVLLLLWLGSGIFVVDAKEQGVVLRFGEVHRTHGPGLHYHLPAPVEKLEIVPVTATRKIEVGFRSNAASSRFGSSRGDDGIIEVPQESSMLTSDEDIVDVPFEVQWFVGDVKNFLFNLRDPEGTVRSAAESAMREVIGRTPISEAISVGKQKIQQEAKDLLQEILDSYGAGVTIEALELRKVKYPAPVRPAFTDVQNAKTEADTAIKRAEAYRNDILPRARGDAARLVEDALAYKEQVVSKAKGEAGRFDNIYDEYKRAPYVTRHRMYLEMMEEVLEDMPKFVLDGKTGNGVVPYLPLNELKRGGK